MGGLNLFVLFVIFNCVLSDSSTLQSLTELAATDPSTAFQHWQSHFKRNYASDEYDQRFEIFKSTAEFISAHNQQEGVSYKLALNEFADLTPEEFKSKHLGYSATQSPQTLVQPTPFTYSQVKDIPSQIDWREKKCVTNVKNQGSCGSCWAFSTTGSVEGVNCVYSGELVSLSEQELVDCDSFDSGCGGGLMDDAYQYIIDNKGIDTELDYGYWGIGTFCNRRKEHDRHVVTINGYSNVPAENETAIAVSVAQHPVSVAVCVDGSFQYYSSGVLDSKCCSALDHGVLIVGYVDEGPEAPYWIVKNSWGESWGEEGYLKMRKDVGGKGQCGIALNASYPIKTSPNPTKVPSICDFFSLVECEPGFSCYCDFDFLNLVCLYYSCVAGEDLVSCDTENKYVCPLGYDQCDVDGGMCTDSRTGDSVERVERVQKSTNRYAVE
eukprot:TRINITY_DN7226_c0_g1_i3.p1 TRINITY_DN7226_c0_g1~~TRINITY_DN7226_c0_g1_i3.p1  ORF type:complete len:438 (-),score=77.44 TRINITY_DN7226_c0_g1_i3:447-1760(-)